MNIEQCEVMVFKYDGQYGASYSIGLSKKNQEGKYENGYFSCKFKKGVEIDNKTKIKIKNAWLTFNQKEGKTYPYIFIADYDMIEEKEVENVETDLFQEFADETIDEDLSDLPF